MSPLRAWRDLRLFLSYREAYELWFGILALALTATILFGFVLDSRAEVPYKPQVTYVESWPLSRSDREIIAQQKIDQVARDKAAAELRERQLKVQTQFKRLDSGLKSVGL